jgi:hypothetical protein
MKKLNNSLAALIGVWFIIAPWALGYSDVSGAVTTSVVIGAVMALSSWWSFKVPGWNLISLLAGVWFIVLPFVYTLDSVDKWISIGLGALVVVLNLWND